MYDVSKCYSSTLLDMPTRIRGIIIKMDDWYYILCNCKLTSECQLKTFLHEMKHLELKHLEFYDVDNRNQNEGEVN